MVCRLWFAQVRTEMDGVRAHLEKEFGAVTAHLQGIMTNFDLLVQNNPPPDDDG